MNKNIPGFENYKISKDGIVTSLKGQWGPRLKTIKPIINSNGYEMVYLMKNGKDKGLLVSRLVLLTYIGEPPGKEYQAAHINGTRTDNRLKNLKWCTRKENESHKIIHKTRLLGEKVTGSKLKTDQVIYIRKSTMENRVLATMFSVHIYTIRQIKNGVIWKHLL